MGVVQVVENASFVVVFVFLLSFLCFLRRQLVTLLKIPGVCLGTTYRFELFGLMVRGDSDLGSVSGIVSSIFRSDSL